MYSLDFPNIFNGSSVSLVKDYDAVKSDLKALLYSNKGGLFGDPYYGTNLKKVLWEQAYEPVIQEIIKDEVFEVIYSYMPQITVDRSSIKVDVSGNAVVVSIDVKSSNGIESNLYQITLLTGEE